MYMEQRVKEEHPWMSKEGKLQNAQQREGNQGQEVVNMLPEHHCQRQNLTLARAELKEKVGQQAWGKASKLNL